MEKLPKTGDIISFQHESWVGGKHTIQTVTAQVLRLNVDPLKIHPTKCMVEVDGEEFGVPVSEADWCPHCGKGACWVDTDGSRMNWQCQDS